MIGVAGGKKSRGGGLTGDSDRAAQIGSKGGKLSKVGMKLLFADNKKRVYLDKHTGKEVVYKYVKTLENYNWIRKI